MLAECEFITRTLKVSTVLSTVAMCVTAAYASWFKPWNLALVSTLVDGE